MTIFDTTAEVDGRNHVTVAVPEGFAGQRVRVVLSTPEAAATLSHAEWVELVDRTAGSIDRDTFVRPPQPPVTPSRDLR